MNVWGLSDQGRVRTQNQDAFFLHVFHEDDQAMAVVCDGMGGAKAGHVASKLAVESFVASVIESLKPRDGEKKMRQVLQGAVRAANTAVHDRSVQDIECEGMGTTLVAALVTGNQAVIANVGDSRAYLVSGDTIQQVTRDHSLVEDMLHQGNLTEEQARNHPSKNFITRALGPDSEVAIDLYTLSVKPGERLLLCTDGLSNVVLNQEMLYEARHTLDPAECCTRLLETANLRGGPDNITMVLFTF